MAILLLTGPTGAGKNTIAALAANQRPRCAVVDFDAVRSMFVHPHKAPWEGDEGWDQHLLGVQMVCALATQLAEADWDVIILDVLWDETAIVYRQQLARFNPVIVQILPTWDEIEQRNTERAQSEGRPRLKPNELEAVYKQQESFASFDVRIDNTAVPAEELADKLCSVLAI